jgi:RNA-directed DNA polymerase
MSTKHIRIAELAKEDKERKFFSIAHFLTQEALYEAFEGLRKDASAGVDGVTYAEYETGVWENIRKLHGRMEKGQYRAQPLRRVYIPKEDERRRPISRPPLLGGSITKVRIFFQNAYADP